MQKVSIKMYHEMGAAGIIGKDTELLYGMIYKKPRKSPLECVFTSRLLKIISPLETERYLVRTFGPITCDDSEPEPNISVVRGELNDFLLKHSETAELVIEVSVGTHEFDRSKLQAYAVAGVKECWLALWPEKVIEVYRAPAIGVFAEKQVFGPGGNLVCASVPGIRVELESLFRE